MVLLRIRRTETTLLQVGEVMMRVKFKKTIRFAADWIAPVGFFTVMFFIWIAACVVALVD